MSEEEFNRMMEAIAQYQWEACSYKTGWNTLFGDQVATAIREYVAIVREEAFRAGRLQYLHELEKCQASCETVREEAFNAGREGAFYDCDIIYDYPDYASWLKERQEEAAK